MIQTISYQKLRVTAEQLLDNAKEHLAANERLKWLLLAVTFFLYLSPVLYLAEVSGTAKQQFEFSRNNLTQLTAQVNETRWPARAQEAEDLVTSLEGRFWQGNTPGLAEAAFERWIRTTLEEYQIEVRQVQLTRRPIMESDSNSSENYLSSLQFIRAKVLAPLDEVGLVRFLDSAAKNEAWVVVEQMVIRPGRNARIEMDLMTVFKTPEN